MKRLFALIITTVMFLSIVSSANAGGTYREDIKEITVHDPSVIRDSDGTYYVFGSQIATAKSTDLINWEYVAKEYEMPHPHFGNFPETLAESFKWAGENDADALGTYHVWAPCVYYNKNYIWKDGTKGAYMMYYSTSSTFKRSCIALAVAKKIDGEYTYIDTLLYSGFTKLDSQDENSTHNNIYKNTNIDELLSKGVLSSYKDEWGIEDYNSIKYPNAIDPSIYETPKGDLYLVYGSWSGGIFVLPVNKFTGQLIYPGRDSVTEDGRMIDRYFGTHIAGGKGMSGEGPYVYYDKEAGYYFLQDSYDWLGTDGGYHIRMFRSKNPTGPFVDITGTGAVYGEDMSKSGVKMFGNYYFESLSRPYTSGGHSSVLIDNDGQRYTFYHTRFKNSSYHRMRVHEMFLNEDNWPVISPFRYMGYENSDKDYPLEDVVGTYEFINHGNKVGEGTKVNMSLSVSLNTDGTIYGAINGTWEKSGKYITINAEGETYKGVFIETQDEKNNIVMTFAAVGSDNCTLWGSMIDADDYDTGHYYSYNSFEGSFDNLSFVTCKKNENPKKADITPAYEDGIKGKALKLDGNFGLRLDGVDLSRETTIGFWIKLDGLENYSPVVSASEDFQDPGHDKWFNLTTFDKGESGVIWSRNIESGQHFSAKKKDVYTFGQWQYITLVFDRKYFGGNERAMYCRLYINGHNVAFGDVLSEAFSSQSHLYIGINPWDPCIKGAIDEITVYERALSHSDVLALYNNRG